MPTVVVRGMPVGRQRISVTSSWVYRELGCARPGVVIRRSCVVGLNNVHSGACLGCMYWHMERCFFVALQVIEILLKAFRVAYCCCCLSPVFAMIRSSFVLCLLFLR